MGLWFTNNERAPKQRLPQSPKAPGSYGQKASNHGGDQGGKQFLHESLRKVPKNWPTPRQLGDG